MLERLKWGGGGGESEEIESCYGGEVTNIVLMHESVKKVWKMK